MFCDLVFTAVEMQLEVSKSTKQGADVDGQFPSAIASLLQSFKGEGNDRWQGFKPQLSSGDSKGSLESILRTLKSNADQVWGVLSLNYGKGKEGREFPDTSQMQAKYAILRS